MREIPIERREQAKELYVVDGLTLEETARRTGISVQTLKAWSSNEGWPAERRDYRQALHDIRRKTVELKHKLVQKALETLDPQVVYAFSRLESAVSRAGAPSDEAPATGIRRDIQTPEDAINALEEAIQNKINTLLSQPGALTLSGIKDMQKALDLVEQMKAKYARPDERKRGLSDETVEDIRRRILGIS